MTSEIVGGIVAGVVLAGLAWLWARKGAPVTWLRQQVAVAGKSEVADEAAQVQVLREQVLEVARAQNVTVAVTASGQNPVVVEFSDGARSWFFRDMATYKRALERGIASPTRSWWNQRPPTPVARWARPQLEAWLAEHAG